MNCSFRKTYKCHAAFSGEKGIFRTDRTATGDLILILILILIDLDLQKIGTALSYEKILNSCQLDFSLKKMYHGHGSEECKDG